MREVPLIIEPDSDDPDFATVMVDATIAGRHYRLALDTGAARTQLIADEYTSALSPVGEHVSSAAFGGSTTEPVVTVTDLAIGPLRIARLDVARGTRGPGQSLGMDVLGRYCANSDQAETPLLIMAGPVIGQRTFASHKAVAVDLSAVNSTLEYPVDLILGYPTIRQANWLFDFPARRWTLTA